MFNGNNYRGWDDNEKHDLVKEKPQVSVCWCRWNARWQIGGQIFTLRSCSELSPVLCSALYLPLQRLYITHLSPSLKQPSAPRESYSRLCSQSELTPRPFSNRRGMFGVAQSNWTVTITNGWFAAARRRNVALNERKHAHQFHTVANTILLWVIVVGHFSFKVLPRQGKSPLLIVHACV